MDMTEPDTEDEEEDEAVSAPQTAVGAPVENESAPGVALEKLKEQTSAANTPSKYRTIILQSFFIATISEGLGYIVLPSITISFPGLSLSLLLRSQGISFLAIAAFSAGESRVLGFPGMQLPSCGRTIIVYCGAMVINLIFNALSDSGGSFEVYNWVRIAIYSVWLV